MSTSVTLQGPVEITKFGRETIYPISADTFRQLWRSYQGAMSTAELTDVEMALITEAEVPAGHDYDYEEDVEPQATPGTGR
jgi:antitoxin StbD